MYPQGLACVPGTQPISTAQRSISRGRQCFTAAAFYPFSQFCGIDVSLQGVRKEPQNGFNSIPEGGRTTATKCLQFTSKAVFLPPAARESLHSDRLPTGR